VNFFVSFVSFVSFCSKKSHSLFARTDGRSEEAVEAAAELRRIMEPGKLKSTYERCLIKRANGTSRHVPIGEEQTSNIRKRRQRRVKGLRVTIESRPASTAQATFPPRQPPL
jgi:hypothetical protein